MWSVIVDTNDGRPPGVAGPYLFGWVAKLIARDINRRHNDSVHAFAINIEGYVGRRVRR
jgi:hypothetical protein